MNNQEAKFVLRAYRPNGVDANDKLFSEPLRQAQQDPELGAWLAMEQSFDAAVAGKLQEITAPAGLRDAILMGSRVSGSPRNPWQWIRWVGLGAAAALLVVTSVALWPKPLETETRLLTNFALRDTAAQHDGHGPEAEVLQSVLSDPGKRIRDSLSASFDELRSKGCRTVAVGGRDIFEICFNRDGKWFHLYALRSANDAESPSSADVVMHRRKDLSYATWFDPKNGFHYAIVSEYGKQSLERLL